MKLFFVRLLFFILFTIGFYIIFVIIWGHIPSFSIRKNLNYKIGTYGHMYTRMREVGSFSNVDVVFLGSSHTYRGFDPRIFKSYGISSFNLGSSAQTQLQTEVLVSRHIHRLKPQVVFYEVYPLSFVGDGVEAAGDLISNAVNDLASLKMVYKLNHLKVYNTFIYASYRDLFNLNYGFKEDIVKASDTYISGGYVETKFGSASSSKTHKYSPIEWSFNRRQQETFEKIIKTLHSEGCIVVLLQAPITKGLFNSCINNDKIDQYFLSKGDYYFNFNRILDLADENFYDDNHLNKKGVAIFNRSLIEMVRKKNIF